MCGGTFESGWTDEEAQKEAEAVFGIIPKAEQQVVCDECYQQLKPTANPATYLAWIANRTQQNQKN